MDTVPYTFHSHNETGTVDAVQPVPGLYVYQLPQHLRHHVYSWLIGHASGKCIAAFVHRSHALGAVDVIADFTDWTQTAADLIANVDAHDLRDLIENRTVGVFIAAKPAEAAA
ncbi:hypothetical protein [Streptomyces sp. NPDC091299]|uniref:hypothetical protein n=1 Tax=Streptomyces sp. NPDC091299 TaxID=3155302 RepID=UPI003440BF4C